MATLDLVHSKLAASQKIFETLNDEHDALEMNHLVEHHFIAAQLEKLKEIIEMAEFLGYGSTRIEVGDDPKIGMYYYCDILSRIPILGEDYDVFVVPARESLIMLCMAEIFESEYDGWGTKVIKKEAQQFSASNAETSTHEK